MMSPVKTLHILNKAPEHARHSLCLSAVGPDDGLLLTENGVLTTTQPSSEASGRYFALQCDLEARGLHPDVTNVQAVSFDEMVELAASAERVISW